MILSGQNTMENVSLEVIPTREQRPVGASVRPTSRGGDVTSASKDFGILGREILLGVKVIDI